MADNAKSSPPATRLDGDVGIGANIVLTFDSSLIGKAPSAAFECHERNQASEHYRAGRFDLAAQLCEAILTRYPGDAEANHMLGVVCFARGDNAGARDFLTRAAASTYATPEMHNNLGGAFYALDNVDEATSAFKRALALRPDCSHAHNNLGVMHHNARRIEAAIESFRRAIQLKPDFAEAKSNLRAVYRKLVPAWHFAMMEDHARNDAYEAAIQRAVAGKYVLDIGTGAGLLSMMAAQAGAAHVVSCEAVRVIAERARDIVAQNGLADQITVIDKRSQNLAVGKDLARRADVLITETFSNGLIDEGVLPTIEHAHAHLLVPGATVIPAAASAIGYLAGGEMLRDMLFAGKVSGFDLSLFDEFAPNRMGMILDLFPHEILSDDAELLRFDFRNRNFPMESHRVHIQATRTETCLGVVQWIKLELDAETRYENRPSPTAAVNGHWTHVVYRFAKPIAVTRGDIIPLIVRNHRSQITVSLA